MISTNEEMGPDTIAKLNLEKQSPKTTKTSHNDEIEESSEPKDKTMKPLEAEFEDLLSGGSDKIKIVEIKETPEYLIDNEYILSGYRVNFNTKFKIVKSLFMIHNESFNVWSHLCGFIAYVILIIFTSFFIHTYSAFVTDINSGKINLEFNNLTSPMLISLKYFYNITEGIKSSVKSTEDYIKNYTGEIKNKTIVYWDQLETNLGRYKERFTRINNCVVCLDELFYKYKNFKNFFITEFDNVKNEIVNKTELIFKHKNEATGAIQNYVEYLTESLIEYKESILDYIDTKEADWVNYKKYFDIHENDKDNMDDTHKEHRKIRKFPIFSLLFGGLVCLGCSTIYHLFCAISLNAHEFLARFDYAGISILIASSCYPPYYYFFFCSSIYMYVYLTFITVFALSVFVFSFKDDFASPEKRKLRGILFLTLGLSAGFPIIHLGLLPHTIKGFEVMPDITFWVYGGISYVLGALMYIIRFPEKYFRGYFDIIGNSHHLHHLGVLFGLMFHYIGSLESFYYRVQNTC